jgi:hypothetical protein
MYLQSGRRLPADEKTIYSRIMSISEAEFIRSLPPAFAGNNIALSNGVAESYVNGRRVRIEFTALPERQIGQLRLPELAISIEFEGFDAPQAADFMAGFDRCFHRGGG